MIVFLLSMLNVWALAGLMFGVHHIARAREEAEALRYLQSIKLDTGYLARLEERIAKEDTK